MKFIADFHIHSHYSLATSKNLVPDQLDYWAKLKGVDVIATGDCIHPGWLSELKKKLSENGTGLLSLKPEFSLQNTSPNLFLPKKLQKETSFILTTEISSIYKKNGKVRKVHNLCVFPNFAAAEKFQKRLDKIGNIRSDGRPILGLDSKNLLEILLETDDKAFLIPAHIWTPWFSVLGSKSGFDSIDECYEDLTQHIFALETGLSSDPPMNRVCSFLDKFNLVSNSDAHSPEKIGREANIFDCEKTFSGIYDALKFDKGFVGTIEFFPQEGKYHYDGHRKCNICFTPLETINHNGICPICHTPLVKGVMYRVAELADRDEPINKKKFYSITSLPDIISEITGKSTSSNACKIEYFKILEKIGSDFHTLLFSDLTKISETNFLLGEAIKRLRNGNVKIKSGYDGEFGEIKMFDKSEIENLQNISLFSDEAIKNKKRTSLDFNIKNFKFEAKLHKATLNDKKPDFSKYVDLSDIQKIIINHQDGPIMAIAGPGTGKTSVLVERIAMLVRNGIDQGNILAITFSNKAAEEIKTRLAEKIIHLGVNTSTFHKLGLKIISENLEKTGREKNFFIVDDEDKLQILKEIFPDKKSVNKILKNISFYKQGIKVLPEKLENEDEFEMILNQYNSRLKKMNAFDLDDLIFHAEQILTNNPEIKENYKKKFKYILVDEYQDINAKQYELILALLPRTSPNLFVIGDPDQAIYGFRGSDKSFVAKLERDFPNIKKIKLEKSYRCPNNILQLGSQILKKENSLEGQESEIITEICECDTDSDEAKMIAEKIDELIGGIRSLSLHQTKKRKSRLEPRVKSFSDFAVLCRTTKIFESIAKKLKSKSIPFQIVGQANFYQEKTYKNLVKKFRDFYFEIEIDLDIKNLFQKNANLLEIFERILENFDFAKIKTDENYNNFKKILENYKANYTDFLRDIFLNSPVDDIDFKEESVKIMTMHASKGLEFEAVFIPGCEEGIIPLEIFGPKTKDELDEENRLFYVAATRSKKYLILSYSKKRFIEGRLLNLQKSSILDRFEKNLFEQKKIEIKNNKQILFDFLK